MIAVLWALAPALAVAIAPDRVDANLAFLQHQAGERQAIASQIAGTSDESDDYYLLDEEIHWYNRPKETAEWSETSKFADWVQWGFAMTWIMMIACLPVIVPLVNRKRPTRSQIIVGVMMLMVFFGGLLLFTHIILFQSVHFKRIRPLTMIECMYFMSQVITTVGYGDITPAKVRGQVFVGLYVLGAMFIISMVVSDVVNQLIESADRYKRHLHARREAAKQNAEMTEEAKAAQAKEDVEKAKTRKANTRKGQRPKPGHSQVPVDGSIEDMLCFSPAKKPPVTGLIYSLLAFAVIDIIWVLFFSLHPGEKKTTFQALYMSVITLSSVGFGWFTPLTEEGMIFGAYFMIFGCAALVNVITQFTELMMKLNEYEKHNPRENKEAAEKSLKELADDNGKVTEVQFFEWCLTQMRLVEQEHLNRIHEAFESCDPQEVTYDANGKIKTRAAEVKRIRDDLIGEREVVTKKPEGDEDEWEKVEGEEK